ncbi:MAG: MGH1-like glycoside hydrolase domain-containing protein, partial [Acidobacteriota bacterium]
FKEKGFHPPMLHLQVKQVEFPEDLQSLDISPAPFSKIQAENPLLNLLFRLIRLTLRNNEVSFPGITGPVSGFSAGREYPQIWLRDSATIIPASRFFYHEPYFISWLEEHLSRQQPDGSLQDWFDSKGNLDKNTTETDQESSAVLAAFQIHRLVGSSWLQKKIAEESIIIRLEKAMSWVLRNRWHSGYGLLKGAHTADWGDIDFVDSDEKAVYVDEKTHWTADIYDQSMFYQACLNLAEMFSSLGEMEKAEFWRKKAGELKQAALKHLWQEEKGFFRIHLHLNDLHHDFPENDILAMGGNTMAILSGLAGNERAKDIITRILQRQEELGISTISGTLLPPYPAGTFQHPLIDQPYEYQNGGQWDWFGGRLILAMFENGFSWEAQKKLEEIIKKNLKNKTFFEWDDKEGTGRGSEDFCGSAGSLALALIEGYLGVKLNRSSLTLTPRLAKESAKVHLFLPACNRFAAYDYKFDPKENSITFCFNSDVPDKGDVQILLPKPLDRTPESLKVTLDGKTVPYEITKENRDVYLVITTDFETRTLKISSYLRPIE